MNLCLNSLDFVKNGAISLLDSYVIYGSLCLVSGYRHLLVLKALSHLPVTYLVLVLRGGETMVPSPLNLTSPLDFFW